MNCDPVMLELFRAEMDTHLPPLSQGLLALEKGRAGEKDIEAMMRAAHSIKGAARIVGVEAAVQVAHAMEDCFSAAQGQRLKLSSEAVDILLQGLDTLQRICAPEPESTVTEQSIATLLERIATVREGRSSPPLNPPAESRSESSIDAQVTSAGRSSESRLALPAVFDEGAAQSLRIELSDILHREPSRLRLDFSRVQHVSAAALSLLAALAREIAHRERVHAVVAEGVSAPVAVLLRTTGLDRTFTPSE